MPIFAGFKNFKIFMVYGLSRINCILGISKIPTVNLEMHSFSCHLCKNVLFLSDTNLCYGKLDLG